MGALAQQPANVEALVACAELHKACGLLADAATALKAARDAAPDNVSVARALAIVLTDLGKQRPSFHMAHAYTCEASYVLPLQHLDGPSLVHQMRAWTAPEGPSRYTQEPMWSDERNTKS